MILLIAEIEKVALGARIVVPKELEACGIIASHAVGVFEFKGVNAAWTIQYKVNFILHLSSPVEDRVLEVEYLVRHIKAEVCSNHQFPSIEEEMEALREFISDKS